LPNSSKTKKAERTGIRPLVRTGLEGPELCDDLLPLE
jgi:hypothetical protein